MTSYTNLGLNKEKVKNEAPELLGGLKNKETIKALEEPLSLKIETSISEKSKCRFEQDVYRIQNYISNDVKYLVVKLFLQLGNSTGGETFFYKNKNDITLLIQPKIKNYISFKSKGSAEKYISEEINDDELYLLLEVDNGKII